MLRKYLKPQTKQSLSLYFNPTATTVINNNNNNKRYISTNSTTTGSSQQEKSTLGSEDLKNGNPNLRANINAQPPAESQFYPPEQDEVTVENLNKKTVEQLKKKHGGEKTAKGVRKGREGSEQL
ncbi:hypothetical protein ABK040_002693 [Willaertia magna]